MTEPGELEAVKALKEALDLFAKTYGKAGAKAFCVAYLMDTHASDNRGSTFG